MTYKQYRAAASDRFPELAVIINSKILNGPEMIKTVAISLFVESDIASELAKETMNQITCLKEDGIITLE